MFTFENIYIYIIPASEIVINYNLTIKTKSGYTIRYYTNFLVSHQDILYFYQAYRSSDRYTVN